MHKNLKYTIGRGRHGRRGSALMVALALLVMLAVFAALFLTSSRFDLEGAAADLDNVRMDLYAEGLAEYVQFCMVADLWGNNDRPLDNDGFNPYTPAPGPTGMPGPDNPYDYFGDTTGRSITVGTTNVPYYADFWLADPRLHAGPPAEYRHAAFCPGSPVPNGPTGAAGTDWQYADMNGDGNVDTPWLFSMPLGDGLFVRAAVRVEDTSNRINVNVANHPLFVSAPSSAVTQMPADEDEGLLRMTLYPGYPLLTSDTSWTTVFPKPIPNTYPNMGDPNNAANVPWGEPIGRFQSELNLFRALASGDAAGSDPASVAQATTDAQRVNEGDTANMPGRHGKLTAAWPHGAVPGQQDWRHPVPGSPYSDYVTNLYPAAARGTTLVPAELQALLGDPDNTGLGTPGRLGHWLKCWYRQVAAGQYWNPAIATTWSTYDPDANARRLDVPRDLANVAEEQDRPFGVAETFDLFSAFKRYNPTSLAGQTRLEQLWATRLNETDSGPQRERFTTYSWTLDYCPYGESPYGSGNFRKVDINTCAGGVFGSALDAANSRRMYGPALPSDVRDQVVANFLDYRDRPMTLEQLDRYLTVDPATGVVDPARSQRTQDVTGAANPGAIPSPRDGLIDVDWDEAAWEQHVADATALPWSPANELTYLTGTWPTYSTAIRTDILRRVSYDTPSAWPTAAPTSFGVDRHPFITEIYANVASYSPVSSAPADQEAAWEAAANKFAVELYNPYESDLSIENYELVVGAPTGTPRVFPFWRAYADVVPPNPAKATTLYAVPPTVPNLPLMPLRRIVVCRSAAALVLPANAQVYEINNFLVFPGERIYLRWNRRTYDPGTGAWSTVPASRVIIDELPATANDITWTVAEHDKQRNDLFGRFWEQAWTYTTGAGHTLGNLNGLGAAPAFTIAPAIANLGTASFLSPADLFNLMREGADTEALGPLSSSMSAKLTAVWGGTDDDRLTLFHRSSMPGSADTIVDQSAKYTGVWQSLLDYVTAVDYAHDGVDNDGNGSHDTTNDLAEARVPGRLNLNTVTEKLTPTSAFPASLTNKLPFLLFLDREGLPKSANDNVFLRGLSEYRDLAGAFTAPPATHYSLVTATGLANTRYDDHTGLEQVGQLCNLQLASAPTWYGWWQDLDIDGDLGANPAFEFTWVLPAQHMRRFARNANFLSLRSDTYMLTVRIEIVRPVYDNTNTLQQIIPFGQREYMYLIDRSYCAEPPQKRRDPNLPWDPINNPYLFNDRFIPPRAWRMTIPSYIAY